MNKVLLLLSLMLISIFGFGQKKLSSEGKHWVDSVFNSLSEEEKISQLMVIRAHSNLGPDHIASVVEQIRKYNVGALCYFQGGPVRQANLTNIYQSIAKTPLMVTIDGEWGLGMRLDSVTKYPFQLTLGSMNDPNIVYEMGLAVGRQMKRIGVHVNYAPVVDVNNNPNNPVIGYRSFGEDKFKVAEFGVAYTRGMQDAGIMACAKHFPGHGDVDVDSHHDLPLISKSIGELTNLELYPFKELFRAGVGSVMIAHLAIPAIDKTLNRPTSLSKNNVTKLLKDDLDYDGLTFTDALEMKGVTKFFPAGEAAVLAIIAGNDMLCLPENVPAAIEAIKAAVKLKRIKWKDIDTKVKRVLAAKYDLGLSKPQVIDTTNLLADLNAETDDFLQLTARNVVTVMNNNSGFFPVLNQGRIAYVGIGAGLGTQMGTWLKDEMKADTFFLSYRDTGVKIQTILTSIQLGQYDRVIIGIHNFSNRIANNYGISKASIDLWNQLQQFNSATFVFGNVYATQNFCSASNLVAMHQDEPQFQRAAVDFIQGKLNASGRMPVTVCTNPYGTGIAIKRFVPVGTAPSWLVIDSIMQDAMAKKAFPGAEVIAVQNGEIKYHKAFGRHEFDSRSKPVNLESIFDLASVTKISATTVSIMKLYDEGKIQLDKGIGAYLPEAKGTDKENLTIRDILLHQAGLNPYIQFYKE
nr:serine hydrolase [Flavisolibacter sp.]